MKKLIVGLFAALFWAIALEASVPLPDGYKMAAFIRSSGKEWIDTGVKPTQKTNIELDMQIISLEAASVCIFGERVNQGAHFALWAQQSTKRVAHNFAEHDSGFDYPGACSFEERRVLSNDGKNFMIDGVSYFNPEVANDFTGGGTMLLFAMRNASSGVDNRKVTMNVYGLKIWEDGVLVRDFVPCENPNGEAGLYDVADHDGEPQRFYGNISGQGGLVAGLVGYERVGYIKTDGDAVIKTDVNSGYDVDVEMDMMIDGFRQQKSTPFFGERITSGKHFAFWADNSTGKVAINYGNNDSGYNYANAPSFKNHRRTLRNRGGQMYIDEKLYYTAATPTQEAESYVMFLFSMWAGSRQENRQIQMRVYSLKIWKAGKLVRDYVPVKDPDGVIGVYDCVGNSFYKNHATTGSFSSGAANAWIVRPSITKATWAVGERPATLNPGRPVAGTVVCSHTPEQLAALGEGTHEITCTVTETGPNGEDFSLTWAKSVTVTRNFATTFARDGQTASFAFPTAAAGRTLYVACDADDKGTDKSKWASVTEVAVAANEHEALDVALPEGFGTAFRTCRCFIDVGGTLKASDPAYFNAPVVVKKVTRREGVVVSADLLVTPADSVRELYLAWSYNDLGADASVYASESIVKVCDVEAGVAEKSVEFGESAKAFFQRGGGVRLFLADALLPKGYTAISYVKAAGAQGIDTGLLVDKDSALTVEVTPYGAQVKQEGVQSGYLKQMRFFHARCGGITSEQMTSLPQNLYFEAYCNGSGRYASCLTDGDRTNDRWKEAADTSVKSDVRHKLRLDGPSKAFYFDDTKKNDYAKNTLSKRSPTNLWLMGGYGTKPNNNFFGYLHSAKLEQGGVVVRDFVPCKNAEGVVGLYDRADHRGECGYQPFYLNDGAGAFSAGDVVVAPKVPALKNGLPSSYMVSDYVRSVRRGLIITFQ